MTKFLWNSDRLHEKKQHDENSFLSLIYASFGDKKLYKMLIPTDETFCISHILFMTKI